MITAYCARAGMLAAFPVPAGETIPEDAVWVDLYRPGAGEDRAIEAALGISVPTRAEMVEIEPSSRLRVENGARYMTGAIVCNSESDHPALAEISFILAGHRLVTVRYDEPKPFRVVVANLDRTCPPGTRGERLLLIMLDTIIDRAADIIERLSADIDAVSNQVFEGESERAGDSRRFRAILTLLGRRGDLASKVRESLVSMGRLITFLSTESEAQRFDKEQRALLKSMQRDVGSLNDHVSYLGNKITFLLDATLGMVGIEQNNIIKIFAVLSVVLMPPTLIASVYGMNFQHMPELHERLGYPLALVSMLAAAVGPYLFFKWKRWL